jgi:DNA modification methylase
VVNAYLNNSDPGDITFDAYCGSGTSIIASEQTGRKCRAIEIDPGYCAVIIDRWETATGKTAERIKE